MNCRYIVALACFLYGLMCSRNVRDGFASADDVCGGDYTRAKSRSWAHGRSDGPTDTGRCGRVHPARTLRCTVIVSLMALVCGTANFEYDFHVVR